MKQTWRIRKSINRTEKAIELLEMEIKETWWNVANEQNFENISDLLNAETPYAKMLSKLFEISELLEKAKAEQKSRNE